MATSLLSSHGYLNAYADVGASATDTSLVAAQTGKKIRVHAIGLSCGATPSTVVFNTKPAGAGTACGPIFNNSISLPFNPAGWFETTLSQGLSTSTGAGSTSGVLVVYSLVHS